MPNAPISIADFSAADKARFFTKINKDGPLPDQSNPHYAGLGPCWVWTAGLFSDGYGQFRLGTKKIGAHRASYALTNGNIPVTMQVLHRCDVRACVNPAHFFTGTTQDNTADKCAKGRQAKETTHSSRTHPERVARGLRNGRHTHPERTARGERQHSAKLTAEKIVAIRSSYSAGHVFQHEIADRFGVSQATVWRVVRRITWKHVA